MSKIRSVLRRLDHSMSLYIYTKYEKHSMVRFLIRELGRRTWPDFVRIMEKHNGVWGGCWCVTFHLKPGKSDPTTRPHRAYKDRLVRANRSHVALVYDGADVVGWCQFGPPAELPGRMRGYHKLGAAPPDWRITCFFVDCGWRREGMWKPVGRRASHDRRQGRRDG